MGGMLGSVWMTVRMTVDRLAQQPKPHRAYQSPVITMFLLSHSAASQAAQALAVRVNFDCFHGVSKLAASNKANGELGEFHVNMYGLGAFSAACYKASAKKESRILVRCSFSLVSMLLRSWFEQALVQDGRNARHLLMPPNVAPSDCRLHTWVLILRCSGLAYIGATCK